PPAAPRQSPLKSDQPAQDSQSYVLSERRLPEPADRFLKEIDGAQLVAWHRRGKYLLGELQRAGSRGLEAAGWLGVHLRMTGQLLWVSQDEALQKHCRVRLFFDDGRELRYVDQRTFGRLWLVPPDKPVESVMTGLQKLGPEPFSDEFSVAYLVAALKGRQRPIKNALLDQRLVAGVGNIYADEALFMSGIRPRVVCDRLSKKRIARLHEAVVQVLTTSIDSGGTTFSDFRDIHGTNGNYGGVAWVYGREGEACRSCGSEIARIQLAGRSAHYCPKCQR
ncbi:MAG: DNA-formamidopyrimidine glycosylase, partial [Cyanobacteria bacterium J06635_11]